MNLRGKLGRYLRTALGASDFVVLNAAFFFALALEGALHADAGLWAVWNVAFIPVAVAVSPMHGKRIVYADRLVGMALCAAAAQLALCSAGLFLFGVPIEPKVPLLAAALLAAGLSVWWIVGRHLLRSLRRRGLNYRAAIIVGSADGLRDVERELRDDAGYGYYVLRRLSPAEAPAQIHQLLARHRIDDIFYAAEANDAEPMQAVMLAAAERGVKFTYVPPINPLAGVQFRGTSVGTLPALEHTMSPLSNPFNRAVKRGIDLAVALPVVVVLPVVSAIVGAAVKLSSPGPVFFRQMRTGLYGAEFTCYKFRTMRVNSESDSLVASPDDSRITRIGAWLRRTSMDELPQFFNVLRGDMSVVGPRPHMLSETRLYREHIERFMLRHSVKPGITGWAQIRGLRGGTLDADIMRRRVEHDVWYISHWTPLLDLKILWITFVNILKGDQRAF